MFTPSKAFLALFSGAFFANLLPRVVIRDVEQATADRELPKAGKGKGRRSHKPTNGAAMQRAARKRKGVAINKARHAR